MSKNFTALKLRKKNFNASKLFPIPQLIVAVFMTGSLQAVASVDHVHLHSASAVAGQQLAVKGRVVDKNGPLPGVTVRVKGGSAYAISDHNGDYSISAPGAGATLVFSYSGYATQELILKDQTVLNVTLVEQNNDLNEVVVVGYGTQKKVNLTGAVDQVGSEVFEDRPLNSTTKGLQGAIPNLNIRITDGKPTRGATYNVRGTTSIGAGGSALILVDGVPGDPDLVNPNDIQSVTVLKDAASAAIYGSRGAFGVVLITTKQPSKDRVAVNFSSSYSLNERTIKEDMVTDGYQWGKTFNDAFNSWNDYSADPQKANSVFPWSQQYLEELKNRSLSGNLPSTDIDPATGKYVYYGSTDWLGELYADRTPSMDQQVSVSGSSGKTDFYLSGRYNNQGGIFRYNPDKFNQYNLRAKGGIQATKWLRIENDITYNERDYYTPILNHPSNTPVWRRISDEAFPVAMLRNPDGTLTENASIVFGSFISGNNYSDEAKKQTRNTTRLQSSFLEDKLKINGDFTFDKTSFNRNYLYTPVPYSNAPGVFLQRGLSKLNNRTEDASYTALNAYGQYTDHFGDHNFSVLLGYNYERSKLSTRVIERDNLINPLLPDFSLIDGQNIILTGGGNEWLTAGAFFRATYNYKSKYLLEVNGRYDGSSKFPRSQQFGFFPSVSAGWNISEEAFWKNGLSNAINNFKLRGSYGSLGNGNIDPYQFLETMSVSRSALMLGGLRPNYTQSPNVVPDGLTWERATTVNLGVDLGFFNNRLSGTFDWYQRNTTNMFTEALPLPATFGATVPKGNYADLKTTGWELSVSWQDQIRTAKPIGYSFRFTLADSKSVIEDYNNPLNLVTNYYKGMNVGEIWGYVNDGYFKDQQDIDAHADQSLIRVSAANKILPGDIKFKDLNGDGVINQGTNTLDNPGDQQVIGNTSLRYQFGLNANFTWNNFSLGAFFQGVGKRDWMPEADNSLFWGAYNRPYSWHPQYVVDNMWSESNPDAYFPRLRGYTALNSNAELTFNQSKYLQNAGYIRLKNLTVGYNLPAAWVNKVHVSSLRVYFTGQNLWTWSPMSEHNPNMDPENIEQADPELNKNAGQGMAYPMLKTYTLGVSISL
jgi:TonB-linked SusC/RagA family outer membrane protein